MTEESHSSASSTINVYLHFPMCFHKYNYKPYLLSYNDAIQSEFIKTLLENEPPSTKNINYTIPHNLYKKLRGKDLDYFMKYWTGDDILSHFEMEEGARCCHKYMAKLAQALLLDDTLPFVKILNEYYPAYTEQHTD